MTKAILFHKLKVIFIIALGTVPFVWCVEQTDEADARLLACSVTASLPVGRFVFRRRSRSRVTFRLRTPPPRRAYAYACLRTATGCLNHAHVRSRAALGGCMHFLRRVPGHHRAVANMQYGVGGSSLYVRCDAARTRARAVCAGVARGVRVCLCAVCV